MRRMELKIWVESTLKSLNCTVVSNDWQLCVGYIFKTTTATQILITDFEYLAKTYYMSTDFEAFPSILTEIFHPKNGEMSRKYKNGNIFKIQKNIEGIEYGSWNLQHMLVTYVCLFGINFIILFKILRGLRGFWFLNNFCSKHTFVWL